MGTPIDLYVYPGMQVVLLPSNVTTKVTLTPMLATDVIPPGASTIPPQAPTAPPPVAHLAAAEVMANLQQTTDLAARALSESVAAHEAAYLAAAPVFTVTPTGQTLGPK